MVRPAIGTNPTGASGSGQKPDPTGSADDGKTAKTEKQEVVAVDAKSITDSVGCAQHGAQYGRDNRNIRICVPVSGRREASHVRELSHALGIFFQLSRYAIGATLLAVGIWAIVGPPKASAPGHFQIVAR
jgi:hypothetical protein